MVLCLFLKKDFWFKKNRLGLWRTPENWAEINFTIKFIEYFLKRSFSLD